MARAPQTRRGVSVKGVTYDRITRYVAEHGGSRSSFLEDLIREKLGAPTEEDRQKFAEETKEREKKAAAVKAAKEADVLADYVRPILFL